MKLIITIILFTLNLLFNYVNASVNNENQTKPNPKKSINSINDFPCYAITGGNGSPNVLFEYSPVSNSWTEIGLTGTSNIEALAVYSDPFWGSNGLIYATDGGILGIINEDTGAFKAIGEVGTGNGELGEIVFDDIDGLTFDSSNGILYATQRIGGIGPGTNDLLLQIDVVTGELLKSVMQDSSGNYVDYAIIEGVFDGTYGAEVYDVEDIAWNPYLNQLYALHSQNSSGVITELDPNTGEIITVLIDLGGETTGGMAISSVGELLVTTQAATGELCILNGFFNLIGPPDSNPFCYDELSNLKVEAFDCSSAINDLALTLELEPSIQEPANTGSEITFLITVHNQGTLDNLDITLINYTPDGLTLSDPNWISIGNGNAIISINEIIPYGGSFVASITFVVDADYNRQTITNAAEIVSSFNYDIIDPNGNPIPLPDIDSNPDDIEGNDYYYYDQDDPACCDPQPGNYWFEEYEDDYKSISVAIEQEDNLPFLLGNIQPENCTTLGSATIQLMSGGTPPFTHQWENIAGEMIHNESSSNQQYQVPNLKAGGYLVTIKDAANRINTFSTVIPFMAPLSGSTNCNNTCPEYVIVPNGSVSGNFMAQQIVEIKGSVAKADNAWFGICE